MDWKEKIRDLSTSLNNFGSLKNLQRGGGALKRLPLCRFLSSQNSSNCCLRSRICSFQSILACRGSQKLYFGDLELTKTNTLYFSELAKSPSRGQENMKNVSWESKVACKSSKKSSQEALNRVLTLPDYRYRRELSIDVLYVTRASICVELRPFYCSKRISVPVSYINVVGINKSLKNHVLV